MDKDRMRWFLEEASTLEPEAREPVIKAMLSRARNQKATEEYTTPGDLACALDHTMVQTPALELIDREIVDCIDNAGRLIITVPPQQGKSMRVSVWTPVWTLMCRQNTRIIGASYAESLAQRNATMARDIINEHGTGAIDPFTNLPRIDRLGISVAKGNATKRSWGIQGRRGSYYATGVGGAATGYSADLLIIDDPIKNQVQADSAREREKVWSWWTAVASTRLSPKAAVIIILTRWHEDDLAGRIIKQDKDLPPSERVWKVVNIPAVAEEGVPDALGREPGTPLLSARGTTLDDFRKVKASVGPRVWSSLYQGRPTPNEGGLFSRQSIDQYRLTDTPHVAGKIVSVDPSESGRGDEAGVLLMGWTPDSKIVVLHDKSRPMTSELWAKTAVHLAVKNQAGDLLYEAFTAKETYRRVIEQAWADLVAQVQMVDQYEGDLLRAVEENSPNGEMGNLLGYLQDAQELAHLVRGYSASNPPFRIIPWRAPGDKVARAAGARQGADTGRLRMVGNHNVLETQMVTWQPGQGSPDRVDALVNGFDHISGILGLQGADIETPWG